jgi:Uma2 family endonuclease
MRAVNELPASMTAAEFIAWNPPKSERWELVDGTPRAMSPVNIRHGTIQNEVGRLIGNHLAENRPASRIITEPGVQPRVRASVNVRVPDLGVTCAPMAPDDRILREPLLLIEILSRSNRAETWSNVWSYVTIPSVREILVLHTAEIRADLLLRQDDGSWPEDPRKFVAGDTIALETIGLSVPLAAFYR